MQQQQADIRQPDGTIKTKLGDDTRLYSVVTNAVAGPLAFDCLPTKAAQNHIKAAAAHLAPPSASFGRIAQAQAAAIVINKLNGTGVGFNDPTPAAPVGGNPGTTLGEQRLFAFTYAANIWGATLTSSLPIIINAQLSALACTATGATLGSAGSTSAMRNFANAPFQDTLYLDALANKLAGSYLGTPNAPQINANFNASLGMNANCLPGRTWCLGPDDNQPRYPYRLHCRAAARDGAWPLHQ